MSNMISISDVMDFLVTNAVSHLPPKALADVFDRLIWCLADNGAELLAVRDGWLRGDDLQKVEIGLAMNETFPLNDAQEMAAVFERIAKRWPALSGQCAEIIARRERTEKR